MHGTSVVLNDLALHQQPQTTRKMKQCDLRWLDVSEMKVLKQIILVSDRDGGEVELGRMIYTRPLSEKYNFKIQDAEDGNDSEKSVDRLFQEYPKQENYPNDRLDEIIMTSVRNSYPKSMLRNESILFNVDLEKIKTLTNRRAVPSTMYLSPEFSNAGSYSEFVGKEFRAPRIEFNIYTYYNPEFLEGNIFYGTYNVSEESILELFNEVGFK